MCLVGAELPRQTRRSVRSKMSIGQATNLLQLLGNVLGVSYGIYQVTRD